MVSEKKTSTSSTTIPMPNPKPRLSAMTVNYNQEVSSVNSFTFVKLLMTWRGSIWKSVRWELTMWVLAFAVVQCFYRYLMTEDQQKFFEYAAIHLNVRLVHIPLTFMLGFFVTIVVDRWRSVFTNIGFIENVALSVGTLVAGTDHAAKVLRRTIIRYLVLSQVLVLRDISMRVRRRFPTMESLVSGGFLYKDELEKMYRCETMYNKYWLPTHWANQLVHKAILCFLNMWSKSVEKRVLKKRKKTKKIKKIRKIASITSPACQSPVRNTGQDPPSEEPNSVCPQPVENMKASMDVMKTRVIAKAKRRKQPVEASDEPVLEGFLEEEDIENIEGSNQQKTKPFNTIANDLMGKWFGIAQNRVIGEEDNLRKALALAKLDCDRIRCQDESGKKKLKLELYNLTRDRSTFKHRSDGQSRLAMDLFKETEIDDSALSSQSLEELTKLAGFLIDYQIILWEIIDDDMPPAIVKRFNSQGKGFIGLFYHKGHYEFVDHLRGDRPSFFCHICSRFVESKNHNRKCIRRKPSL